MEELLQEFRVWEMAWMTFNVTKRYGQPLSVEEFVKELEKKYKVTKLQNE